MKDNGKIYVRFDIDMPDHAKIAPLSDAAFRCLFEAVFWARKQLADGLLPFAYAEHRWGEDVLRELCTNDDLNPSLERVEHGYLIHNYADHQPTKAEIEAIRQARKTAGTLGGLASAKQRASKSQPKRKQPLKQVVKQNPSKSNLQIQIETELEEGEGYVSNAHAPDQNGAEPAPTAPPSPAPPAPPKSLTDDPPDCPPRYCPRHMPAGTLDPCRDCAAARTTRQDWLAETSAQASEAARLTAQAERRAANTARLDAVAACPMCDEDGYRITTTGNPGAVCDHIDHRAQTTHGRALAAEVLAEIRARKAARNSEPNP